MDGLYHQKYDYPPETILSHTFYRSKTDEFYKFYKDKMLCLGAKPNAAHLKLAELEEAGKITAVITQNIDGLHQAAGSKKVYELHGSVLRNYCEDCGKFYDAEYFLHSEGLIDYYRGSKLVLINKAPTSRDNMADLVISGPIGEILSQIKVHA